MHKFRVSMIVGPLGVKAICVALVSNTTIEVLDLHDNGLENTGCAYVAEMLKENYFITELVWITPRDNTVI